MNKKEDTDKRTSIPTLQEVKFLAHLAYLQLGKTFSCLKYPVCRQSNIVEYVVSMTNISLP